MRILMVCPSSPLPPRTGGKLRMYHAARVLSATDDVTVCALVWSEEEARVLESETAFRTVAVRHRVSKARALAGALIGGLPTSVVRFSNDGMRRAIDEMLGRERFGVIWCHTLACEANVPDTRVPLLLDAQNLEVQHWKGIATGSNRAIWRAVGQWNARAWEVHERRALQRFRWVLSVSEAERDALARTAAPGTAVWTVPNGVRIPLKHPRRLGDRPSVIFCGAMHMAMNDEAACWLMREIVPRVRREIPDCDFVLVGGIPTARVRRVARRAKVRVTGLVPDVEPYYRAATVAVVPVRMGGGTKIKALEAMSYGLPLVSTSAGVQGIDIVPLVHAIVADDPDRFAGAVIRSTRDRVASDRMGAAARDLVQQRYLWDDIYGEVRHRLVEGVTSSPVSLKVASYSATDPERALETQTGTG